MKVISADTIGPLPEDEFGNKFILVVIDQFTRFVELYAVKDQTTKYAAQALLSHIGRYGAPQALQNCSGVHLV